MTFERNPTTQILAAWTVGDPSIESLAPIAGTAGPGTVDIHHRGNRRRHAARSRTAPRRPPQRWPGRQLRHPRTRHRHLHPPRQRRRHRPRRRPQRLLTTPRWRLRSSRPHAGRPPVVVTRLVTSSPARSDRAVGRIVVPLGEQLSAVLRVGVEADPRRPCPAEVHRYFVTKHGSAVGADQQRIVATGQDLQVGAPRLEPPPVRSVGDVAETGGGEGVHGDAGGEQRTHDTVLGGEHRFAQELPTKWFELVLGKTVEGGDEPCLGRYAGVDLRDAKWSSSTISARATPVTLLTASWASATMRKAKFGAQKNVGSRNRTRAVRQRPACSWSRTRARRSTCPARGRGRCRGRLGGRRCRS